MVPPIHSDPIQSGLDPAELIRACPQLASARRLLIGFSGGLDSTVLLHLISALHVQKQLHAPVIALHVNHGLQTAAAAWQQHCAAICEQLQVPLLVQKATVNFTNKESPEEAARSARYAIFARLLAEGDILLLAHHQDDQVETVLFRLMRGSGPKGLAGIPVQRSCGSGSILRPMAGFRRSQMFQYAVQQQLVWIEDSSNRDERYDRNFLRSSVIPRLEQRFPGMADAVIRSAVLCRESDELLGVLGALDLAECIGTFRNRLQIAAMHKLSEARQRNLLRFWIAGLKAEIECAAPGHTDLQRIVTEVIPAAPDGEPSVFWGHDAQRAGIRRFRNQLYFLKPLPASPEELLWNTAEPLELPFPLGRLQLIWKNELAVPEPLQQLRVRFRKGGEEVKQANRPVRALKKILQESAVPPWLRESVPLLYTGPELLAVADLLICRTSLQNITETDVQIRWLRPELHCGY